MQIVVRTIISCLKEVKLVYRKRAVCLLLSTGCESIKVLCITCETYLPQASILCLVTVSNALLVLGTFVSAFRILSHSFHISDQDRIFPYIINTISSRRVMRIKKNIKRAISS